MLFHQKRVFKFHRNLAHVLVLIKVKFICATSSLISLNNMLFFVWIWFHLYDTSLLYLAFHTCGLWLQINDSTELMPLSKIAFDEIKEYLHIPIDIKYILSSTKKVRQCTRLDPQLSRKRRAPQHCWILLR